MQAFLAAWLDELSAMDALRLCAASRSAREALGADGVAAAAFAATRPWRANCGLRPLAGSLRVWRRAWGACSNASSALGLRGGAWLKTATVIPANSPATVAVTLDVACARHIAEEAIRQGMLRTRREVIAILLMSGRDATFCDFLGSERPGGRLDLCVVELQMLVLFEDSQFGAVIADDPSVQLTANPLDVCNTVVADGVDTCLLVPEIARPFESIKHDWRNVSLDVDRTVSLDLDRMSSGMKRVARDGEAYDLFEFTAWYDGGPRARRFWQEAPPEAEHHSRREIALEGMLSMSALRMLDNNIGGR